MALRCLGCHPASLPKDGDGADREREIPLETAAAGDVTAAAPWRTFRSHRNQRHYWGWYWSSTTGDHVIYESRLELARLLLADADPDIVGIAAQPFPAHRGHRDEASSPRS